MPKKYSILASHADAKKPSGTKTSAYPVKKSVKGSKVKAKPKMGY